MTGTAAKQVKDLWILSGIDRIGESRHEAKSAAMSDGARTSAEVARSTGISSFATKDAYLGTWKELAQFAREERLDGGPVVKDITRLTPELVGEFLRAKAEAGVSLDTLSQYGARVNKLGDALQGYNDQYGKDKGKVIDFTATTEAVKAEYKDVLDRSTESRNYDNPRALVGALENPTHQLVAALQLDAKMRISEATLIRAQDLRGTGTDPKTGREVGYIAQWDSKGGKNPVVPVALDTYRATESHILANGGELVLKDHDSYREALKDAAAATGQQYHGSHGLRWNGACERLLELKDAGVSYPAALQQVSKEMGHERLSITRHYTKSISPW